LPTNENFEIELQIPELSDGEFLVRNIWMSVDLYMRARMSAKAMYRHSNWALEGGCVGKESKNKQLTVGDYVLGMKGWRGYQMVIRLVEWLSTGLS
jgi:NADPH-dependent curcumin reductase CurA